MMLRKLHKLVLLITLVVATVMVVPNVFAIRNAPVETREFDNGYAVAGDNLIYMDSLGGVRMTGYPITKPYVLDGHLVQDFQNIRMKLVHTDNGPKVILDSLGTALNPQRTLDNDLRPSNRIVYFPGSAYPVSYYFLDFYLYYGAEGVLGKPITGMFQTADGKMVQYFENVKLVYDMFDTSKGVYLGNLGEIYLDANHDKFPSTAFISPMNATPGEIVFTSLEIVMDVDDALYNSTGNQGVDIVVFADDGVPVANANVEIWLVDGYGTEIVDSRHSLVLDDKGSTRHVIVWNEGGEDREMIKIYVRAEYAGISETECLLFELWPLSK